MNSLKFNEVDWTVVVKKVDEATKKEKIAQIEAAKNAAAEADQSAETEKAE
jgi:hypothetical protein